MPLFLKNAIERHVDELPLKGSAVLCRTFASTALAEGVPISEVSRWLGHVDYDHRGPVRPFGA
jgi:hypothetical protein